MRHTLFRGSIVVLALSLAAAPLSAQVQRSFGGENVHLELSSGNYLITGSYDGRIRVLPRTKTDQVSVRLNVSTFGRRANVKVLGPQDGFDADIELPQRVNIVVTLASGVLRVRGLEGGKNITGKTGEIEIELGDRNQYRQITASVKSGGVMVPGARAIRPGIRTFDWTGTGAHDLRVRLDAGNITLRD
jgi:hypothetical protein